MTGVPEVILDQYLGGSWVDLTSRLAAFEDWGTPMQITRGIGDAGDVTPGSFTLTLENDDGALTPGRATSPYYPNLTRFRPIRLRAFLNGVWHGRFSGFVDAEPLAWERRVVQPAELPALLEQAFNLAIRGQRNHPKTPVMARNDIQGIHADRPGRTEHGNILNFWHLL